MGLNGVKTYRLIQIEHLRDYYSELKRDLVRLRRYREDVKY